MFGKALETKEFVIWETSITYNGFLYAYADGLAFYDNGLTKLADNNNIRCFSRAYPKNECIYYLVIKMPLLNNAGGKLTSDKAFGFRILRRDDDFEKALADMCNTKTYQEVRDWIVLTFGW